MIPKFDFSGYATKIGLKCGDGRIIMKDAFKHMDGKKVPLVWQHMHDDPGNILGHAILESRDDGVYAFCKFNESESAQNAKAAVMHGDITSLSIYANQLKEQAKKVVHGMIREVSLVMAGSNPGALIDNLYFAHSDTINEEEAFIYWYGDEDENTNVAGIIHGDEIIEHMTNMDGERILSEELSTLSEAQKSKLKERLRYNLDDTQMDVIFNIIRAMNDSQRLAVYKLAAEDIGMAHDGIDLAVEDAIKHAASGKYSENATIQDIFNTLDDTQKTVVYAMVAEALSSQISDGAAEHSEKEGDNVMKNNLFDNQTKTDELKHNVFDHEDFKAIWAETKRCGSFKEAFIAHADSKGYGVDNIEYLFPDHRNLRTMPDMIKRDDDWVAKFFGRTNKNPFSRIKSTAADLTEDEARAKGYITGKRKKEEVFPVMRRTTSPTTIYKKQKLDRDDIVDVTDFDIVAWLRAEMRLMLNEEIARAGLIGDGRAADHEDKIDESRIRPIWADDELFAPKVELAADTSTLDFIDEVVRSRKLYKGSGNPTLYTTEDIVTDMLLVRDLNQRRIYPTMAELASALRVSEVIAVEVMEDQTRTLPNSTNVVQLMAIMVNEKDYTYGADKGGEVTMFDDFDIDYNQQKYLIETRISGALTKPKSAVVIEKRTNG